jgi:hypothetical protein
MYRVAYKNPATFEELRIHYALRSFRAHENLLALQNKKLVFFIIR